MSINVVINDDKIVDSMQDQLEQLGFTQNEAKVYLACLELGETRAQAIIRKVRLPRATVYLTLEELEAQGLVASYDKNNIKHFLADDPRKIIERKKEEAKLADTLFPELKALYGTMSDKPGVRLYRGLNQIKDMYNELLSLGVKKYRVIGSEEGWVKADEQWFNEYAKRRGEKGIKVNIIFEQSPAAKKSAKEWAQGRKIKFLPRKYKNRIMTSDCTILDDRVIFHNYGKEMVGVAVESKEAAQLMQLLFDLAWDSVK